MALVLVFFGNKPMSPFYRMITVAIMADLAWDLAQMVLRADSWRALVAASYFK